MPAIEVSFKGVSDNEAFESEILREIGDEWIFWKYMGENFRIGQAVCSPLRSDSKPSFVVYRSGDTGRLFYYDFGTRDTGSCLKFVSRLYGLSYLETMYRIRQDWERGDIAPVPPVCIREREDGENIITVQKRPYTPADLWYWNQFGVTSRALFEENVLSADMVWLNGKIVFRGWMDGLVYAYKFSDRYKIYRPLAKNIRWISSTRESDINGLETTPSGGDLLIITKSMKDVLCLKSMGFASIAPQSESSSIPETVITRVKEDFQKCVFLYDNDDVGIRFAKKIGRHFDLPFTIMPIKSGAKDVSEFYVKHGPEITKSTLNRLINDTQEKDNHERKSKEKESAAGTV